MVFHVVSKIPIVLVRLAVLEYVVLVIVAV